MEIIYNIAVVFAIIGAISVALGNPFIADIVWMFSNTIFVIKFTIDFDLGMLILFSIYFLIALFGVINLSTKHKIKDVKSHNMSKSRAKKFRFCNTDKIMKRFANKKVRQNKWFSTPGNLYKRLFESWKINDSGRARPIPKENDVDMIQSPNNNWKAKAKRK